MNIRIGRQRGLSLLLMVLLVSNAMAGPPTGKQKRAGKKDRAALEKAFAEKMTGATLVGSFTITGRNETKPPRPERYELGTVKKLKGDSWLWVAKIQYGNKDTKVPLPLTLTVKWAGDTPVITLTNFTVPGLGTFTARVLFYGDKYVGTWQHGKVGGHMFGRIEPARKKRSKKPAAGKSSP